MAQSLKTGEFVSSLANLVSSVAVILGFMGLLKEAEVAKEVAIQVPVLADHAVQSTQAAVQLVGETKEAVATLVESTKDVTNEVIVGVSSLVAAFTRPFFQFRGLFR